MATGILSNGVDLDSIFAAYITGTKKPATGYTVAGQDLSDRFQPYVDGPAAGATGYRIAGGADLNTLFAPFGWSPNTPFGFDGKSYLHSREAPATTTISMTLQTDGNWRAFGAPGTVRGTGPWLSLLGGTVGQYEAEFHKSGQPEGPWQSLSSNRSCSTSVSSNEDAYLTEYWVCRVRRASDHVVVSTNNFQLTAEVLIF